MGALLMTDRSDARDTSDELLNIQQVAEVLGISRPTVYKLLRRGLLIPISPDSPFLEQQRRKFRRSDVERLLRGEAPESHN